MLENPGDDRVHTAVPKPQGSGPVERGTGLAERACVQPGQPVVAAGAAEKGRPLVAHQLAAAPSVNRRPLDQACPVLLATPRGEPADAAVV